MLMMKLTGNDAVYEPKLCVHSKLVSGGGRRSQWSSYFRWPLDSDDACVCGLCGSFRFCCSPYNCIYSSRALLWLTLLSQSCSRVEELHDSGLYR